MPPTTFSTPMLLLALLASSFAACSSAPGHTPPETVHVEWVPRPCLGLGEEPPVSAEQLDALIAIVDRASCPDGHGICITDEGDALRVGRALGEAVEYSMHAWAQCGPMPPVDAGVAPAGDGG